MTCTLAQPASASLRACGVTPCWWQNSSCGARLHSGFPDSYCAKQLQAEPLLHEGSSEELC